MTQAVQEHMDVVIVGAGVSGIGAACHLNRKCPDRRYVILESRGAIGGTWDLFRYPGIRSDSDMHTFGYEFKPWRNPKSIADGPSILDYVREAAEENGVLPHIRYHQRVISASWSTPDARWTVEVAQGESGERTRLSCNFLFMCSGYYSYESGYTPEIPGLDQFQGTLIHPQFWPNDLDHAGKQVAVIGSGATAMTLVPAMADSGARVTMIQRSPTYVASRPDEDRIANRLRRYLPERLAYAITRWKNILLQHWIYRRTRVAPERVKEKLLAVVRRHLGEAAAAEHFTPAYNPWDERLCLIPNGDLLHALREGRAEVVTDTIRTVTANGVLLESGREIEADILVTATGLNLSLLGKVAFDVDGAPVKFPETLNYKGMMYADVPNMANVFGYVNASWTLRADLTADYVCQVLNRMQEIGMRQCTPRTRPEDADMPRRPWIVGFNPGYMARGMHLFPQQGDRDPWRNTQNYLADRKLVRRGLMDDEVLEFSNPLDAAMAAGTDEVIDAERPRAREAA